MITRSTLIVLVVLLLIAAGSGWYMYYREFQRADALEHMTLKKDYAIEDLVGTYTSGLFSEVDATGKVLIRVPTEVQTGDGSTAIIYEDFQYTPTATTEYKKYDGATSAYTPTQLSDFKRDMKVVFEADAKGELVLLYLIQ